MTDPDHGERFRELHQQGTFVLLNAWDAASARIIAQAGARALATTSSAISWSLGVPDGQHLDRGEMIGAVRRVASAVDLPISADLESGYGPDPSDVAATIEAAIGAGAVGANLEDRPGPGEEVLWPVQAQRERLAAARAAADGLGVTFTINARTDVYLASVGEPHQREAMVLERAQAYRDAGADCLFVPGVTDLETIGRIVADCGLPVNILLAPGRGPGIGELERVGVRRISVGGAIGLAAYATVRRAAEELLAGQDQVLRVDLAGREMQELMA